MTIVLAILFAFALGGVAFAFTGGDEKTQKRVSQLAKPAGQARGRGQAAVMDAAQKRKNVAVLLKDVEKNRAAKKERPTMRRRLEQAGFPKTNPRNFWMICGIVGAVAASVAILTHQKPLVIALAVFAIGLGLPRWVLSFLAARRKKKFTEHFATAIDV
ncbi:MAG TPA: hypothetical protein VHZ32_09845, partial [Rhizomicrobium sp.]|nr:hypothetical protein [Rhizomicrobium sp.]